MKVSALTMWKFGKENHGGMVEDGVKECQGRRKKRGVLVRYEDAWNTYEGWKEGFGKQLFGLNLVTANSCVTGLKTH